MYKMRFLQWLFVIMLLSYIVTLIAFSYCNNVKDSVEILDITSKPERTDSEFVPFYNYEAIHNSSIIRVLQSEIVISVSSSTDAFGRSIFYTARDKIRSKQTHPQKNSEN